MLINDYKALRVDKDVIPTKQVYKIVNQFFIFAQKFGTAYLPCLRTWQYYCGDIKQFAIYAYIARRYRFSCLKRRGEKWYENGKLIIDGDKLLVNDDL